LPLRGATAAASEHSFVTYLQDHWLLKGYLVTIYPIKSLENKNNQLRVWLPYNCSYPLFQYFLIYRGRPNDLVEHNKWSLAAECAVVTKSS